MIVDYIHNILYTHTHILAVMYADRYRYVDTQHGF